jgi:hypothetical protein
MKFINNIPNDIDNIIIFKKMELIWMGFKTIYLYRDEKSIQINKKLCHKWRIASFQTAPRDKKNSR